LRRERWHGCYRRNSWIGCREEELPSKPMGHALIDLCAVTSFACGVTEEIGIGRLFPHSQLRKAQGVQGRVPGGPGPSLEWALPDHSTPTTNNLHPAISMDNSTFTLKD
jgi:hypothetical protein